MAVEDITTKHCNTCGNTKPITEFSKDSSKRDGLRTQCRICRRIVDASYAAVNRDKARERASLWYAANLSRAKEARTKWYLANAEKVKARAAKWQADNPNPERERSRKRKWLAANQEREKARAAKWRKENTELCRAHSLNRRARKLNAGGKLSTGLADKLFKLQRGKCACGCKQPLGDDYHCDHIMPLALGGSNTDDNIQLLRAKCNLQKNAKHPVDFMQQRGFLI